VFYFSFVLAILGIELRVTQMLYHLSHAPRPHSSFYLLQINKSNSFVYNTVIAMVPVNNSYYYWFWAQISDLGSSSLMNQCELYGGKRKGINETSVLLV
jgi:hypothetical protein